MAENVRANIVGFTTYGQDHRLVLLTVSFGSLSVLVRLNFTYMKHTVYLLTQFTGGFNLKISLVRSVS